MKKEKSTISKTLFTTIIILIVSGELFAQGNNQNNSNGLWQATGNDTVTTNREVLIKKDLTVKQNVKTDTVFTNVIKVGKHSLYIGNPIQQNEIGSADYIQSSIGKITFGNYDDINFWDMIAGIGADHPFDFDLTGLLRGLEVNNDINLTSNVLNENHGYRIAGNIVLQTPDHSNTFVGEGAGILNNVNSNHTSGVANSFVGNNAGTNNTEGSQNSFLGTSAGYHNTGSGNCFIGFEAGYNNYGTSQSVFIGNGAGRSFDGNQITNWTDTWNTFVGTNSGYLTTTGLNNTFIGSHACSNNTTGHENTVLGDGAGNTNTIGSENMFIGHYADVSNGSLLMQLP